MNGGRQPETDAKRRTQLVLEGLVPPPRACLPWLHTGLTRPPFHCCWFGTNPSNFLLRQDKMCLPYLFIRLHIFLYLLCCFFFFFFFFSSACLQMRVCAEQIRLPQPRTEGTESTRNKKKVERGGSALQGNNTTPFAPNSLRKRGLRRSGESPPPRAAAGKTDG